MIENVDKVSRFGGEVGAGAVQAARCENRDSSLGKVGMNAGMPQGTGGGGAGRGATRRTPAPLTTAHRGRTGSVVPAPTASSTYRIWPSRPAPLWRGDRFTPGMFGARYPGGRDPLVMAVEHYGNGDRGG